MLIPLALHGFLPPVEAGAFALAERDSFALASSCFSPEGPWCQGHLAAAAPPSELPAAVVAGIIWDDRLCRGAASFARGFGRRRGRCSRLPCVLLRETRTTCLPSRLCLLWSCDLTST